MLNTSTLFKNGIVADSRKIKVKALMDIISPDITYGTVGGSATTAYSRPAQIHDGITELAPYATLEKNRWALDGTFDIAFTGIDQEIAWESSALGNGSGNMSVNCQLPISGVAVLQALTLYWPTAEYDGLADTFTVEVQSGGTAYYTLTVSNNTSAINVFKNFTVYNPDLIKITITKWSIPFRRARIPEIFCGLREEWDNDTLAEFTLQQQADFSCVTLPFGTAKLVIDNSTREFEPRAKNNLFLSLEERQGIKLYIGVNEAEYIPLGIYYLFSNGWKTSTNALSMEWSLVDIIGLISDRRYVVPETLPTTLEGWIESITAQLGSVFAENYIVDPNYASTSLTVLNTDQLADKTCGQILLWCCQASGTFPRADASTGKLAIEPFWSQGNRIDLDNIERYPTISANKDVAFIKFNLPDGTVYTMPGTSNSSPNTVEITNPFIHDQAAALTAGRDIISIYGGNILSTLGRGNPSSEIGDVPTVQLDESNATTGRLYYQDFIIQDGVLKGCTSQLLQSDGAASFEKYDILTASGIWTAPAGVTKIKIILVGGGSGGAPGTAGTMDNPGLAGNDGLGGKVFYATINVNAGQSFAVVIGAGADSDSTPGETTFGSYSSADGHNYFPSFTDVGSGLALGRSGVADPTGNGDGGKGGEGGLAGTGRTITKTQTIITAYPNGGTPFSMDEATYNALMEALNAGGLSYDGYIDIQTKTTTEYVYDTYPTNGTPGVSGADGVAIVYYDI